MTRTLRALVAVMTVTAGGRDVGVPSAGADAFPW